MKRIFTLMALLCFALLIQCKTAQPPILELYPESDICLLDSTAAARAISKDDIESFFDKIRTLDMEIQMGQSLSGTRAENIQTYRDFLQKDVTNFTEEEAKYIRKTMNKARQLCDLISPDIFPKPINFIKTKANHYGESVYYTRENNIIIPYDVLGKNRNESAFLETMLHEIFHIYSRLNPNKRTQLYELIGFKKAVNVQLPKELDRRLLINPDGIFEYVITVSDGRNMTQLIPLLYSKTPEIAPNNPGFFNYLQFELFEIENEGDLLVVQAEEGYKSTMRERFQGDFQRQISNNTGYIWHPDEIMADNFAFLALIKGGLLKMKDFESEGRDLLRRIETVLRE